MYDALRDAIHGRKFQPGARLRELEIAQWLGVSRTPVREALRQLEAHGLLTDAPRRGLIVTELASRQVLELYALREVLEGMAASLAAHHSSPSEVQTLRAMITRQRAVGSDAPLLADLNHEFHETIYQAARNSYLIQALAPVRDALALLPDTTYSVPGRPAAALAEHLKIVEAIRRRDSDAAEEAARRHLRASAEVRLLLVTRAVGAPADIRRLASRGSPRRATRSS